MSSAQDTITRYGAVAIGLVLGTAAKYGLAINDGKPFTWKGLLADLLLLGLLGLIAVTVSDWSNLTGNGKVLAGALAALSSDRIIRLLRKWFERRIIEQLDAQIPTATKTSASVADRQMTPIGETDGAAR